MDPHTIVPVVAVAISAVAAAITAWMAIETRRLGNTATRSLEIELAPLLGIRDVRIEVSAQPPPAPATSMTGIRLGLELTNAGRVPVRYKVTDMSVTFAARVAEREHYLSRGGLVLPGASTIFWHSGMELKPPIAEWPAKGRVKLRVEYGDDALLQTRTLSEVIEFTIFQSSAGFRVNWLHVDESNPMSPAPPN